MDYQVLRCCVNKFDTSTSQRHQRMLIWIKWHQTRFSHTKTFLNLWIFSRFFRIQRVQHIQFSEFRILTTNTTDSPTFLVNSIKKIEEKKTRKLYFVFQTNAQFWIPRMTINIISWKKRWYQRPTWESVCMCLFPGWTHTIPIRVEVFIFINILTWALYTHFRFGYCFKIAVQNLGLLFRIGELNPKKKNENAFVPSAKCVVNCEGLSWITWSME